MLGIYLMLGALFLRTCSSLKCYSCTLNSIKEEPYQSCATIPGESVASTLISECHDTCLTVAEFKEKELWKLTRGCGEESLEQIVDDGIQRKSILCREDFCNNQSVTALTSVMFQISSESMSLSFGDQSGRDCYSCVYSYNGPGSDDRCVTDPSTDNIVKCPEERECHVFQQYDKGEGLVRSFQRGCNIRQMEGCVEDTHFITCNRFCDSHLCNDWDGTKPESKRDCYSCVYSYNGPGSDDRCVTDPSSAPYTNIIKCPEERECHVFQQYDKGEGLVRSFQRGRNIRQMEGCVEDTHFITCNRFCDSQLCNDWDGTKPLVGHSEAIKSITLESKRDCYSCVYSYNGPGSDDRCVTDPSTDNIVKCQEERECHVFQQYDKGEGSVRSFQRGCNIRQMEGCVEDTHFITCNKFCDSQLCNDWDGTKLLVGHSEAIKVIAGFIIPLSWLILDFVTN